MAGVKVTDLTTLGTADANDIMYIVDTTANQSKKIEVQNIYDGLPQFESGVFTITPSGENDCTVSPLRGHYSRVNDIVTCTYYFDLQATNGAGNVSFNLNPPVGSNFANARDAFGVMQVLGAQIGDLLSYGISADTANDQITFTVEGTTPDFLIQALVAQVQYLVI